jgi:hypothetical protein
MEKLKVIYLLTLLEDVLSYFLVVPLRLKVPPRYQPL